MKKILLSFFASALILLSVISCEKEEPAKAWSISLDETNISLLAGESKTLTATISPDNTVDSILFWETSDKTVATVDDKGTITALSIGDAIITVSTAGKGVSTNCLVKVVKEAIPIKSITLENTEMELEKGTTASLSVTVTPENATHKKLSYTSSNTSAATVDTNGMIIALKRGNTTITVTAESGVQAVCKVTVIAPKVPVSSISLDKSQSMIQAGTIIQLISEVLPANATNKNIIWSSSSESVATVDNQGIVQGIAEGIAKITATTEDGGHTAECTVTVTTAEASTPEYIDENGINQGKGVKIGEMIWAPVNCGYDKDKYPYGKYYQWGRKGGFGYDGEQTITYSDTNPESLDAADPDTYYNSWHLLAVNGTWGTEDPWNIKNATNDPCPEGWRVPNTEELKELTANHSDFIEYRGQKGMWFSGNTSYTDAGSAQIFLPAGGHIKGGFYARSDGGYYWSASPNGSLFNYSAYLYKDNTAKGDSQMFRYVAMQVRCIYDSKE